MAPEQRLAHLEYRMAALEKDVRELTAATGERTGELARAHNALANNTRLIARKMGILPEQRWWRRLAAWFNARMPKRAEAVEPAAEVAA